uniref:ADAM metallopeptidase domain 12 n=1 Tax=Sinocyclocheilus grahami TaxID=75366 RepID=A0A672RAS2_SINGR
SLSTCTGLRGLISLEHKVYILEPMEEGNTHRLYRGDDLKLTQGTCGHGHNISYPTEMTNTTGAVFSSHSRRHKRDAQSSTKHVELIIVADNREYQKQGKDVEKVKQRLAEIANYVDKFYRSLNIRVALVGLEVWSDGDKCSITQDPFTSLHEFLDWRKLKLLPQRPHDNAQLISGVYFQGTTIGMAPIMSMCTAEQSGGIVMDHSDDPLGAAVTLAHELGHNFGMNHDTPERGCGCRATVDRGGCIMTPSTGYPFPTVFSTCSKKDLAASLEKGVGMCLFNMPEVKVLYGGQKCGNGYVEEGEQCDCGDVEECLNPCCRNNVAFSWCTSGKQKIKSTFKNPQDAKCGKIQCQGGANRPVIGTNAVSIETNIPLQEGGRILCRGTHVYLGDDMPDPGLVLTGTKCGENMMCINRQCQNISVLGVHDCSAKCSGHGVCNNNENCHCESLWAPPFCDKAGFGGSMDSGPMRPTDSSSVTVGILVAFLCLLCVGIIVCIKRKTLSLFSSNKKNTIEKLRYQTCTSNMMESLCDTSLSTVDSVVPSHGLRRLPPCPLVHLSHPLPLALGLPLTPPHTHSTPPRAPPPALTHTSAPAAGAAGRSLACQNVCKIAMVSGNMPALQELHIKKKDWVF